MQNHHLKILAIGLLLISQLAFTQKIGTIKGQVLDLSQTGVPLAKIQITKDSDKYETKTDRDGKYELNLPAGNYRLVVSRDGFLPSKVRTIKIEAEQITELNITLCIQRSDVECQTPAPEQEGKPAIKNH